jgi:hypothetical protein
MTPTNSSKEGGRDRTAKSGVVVESKFLLGLVEAKDAVGLVKGRSNRNSPETIRCTSTVDDNSIHFNDFDVIFGKNSCTIIIAQLRQRNECAGAQIVEDEGRLCGIAEEWREGESATLRGCHASTAGRENSRAIGERNRLT